MAKEFLFESQRLYFQKYAENDFADFNSIMTDPELRRHTTGVLTPEEVRNLFEKILNDSHKRYAIFLKLNSEYIGHIGLTFKEESKNPYVAYIIKQDYQKQGLATEALKALADYASKTLGYKTLMADAFRENIGSYRVLEKVDFNKIGERKDHKNNYFVFKKMCAC